MSNERTTLKSTSNINHSKKMVHDDNDQSTQANKSNNIVFSATKKTTHLPFSFKWFKTRPLENASNTVSTANDIFQTTAHFFNTFTPLLQNFRHLPIIGTIFLGIDNLTKTITTLIDPSAPKKNKVISITLNSFAVILASLGIAFSSASFGFVFGFAMAGLGIAGASFGLFNAANTWYKANKILHKAQATKALEDQLRREQYLLESNPNLTEVQLNRLDAINHTLLQRKNALKALDKKIIEQKFYKSVKEIDIAKRVKINPSDPSIKTLKTEAKALKQSIAQLQVEKQVSDSRPDNIKKLAIKAYKAKINTIANITGTALAAAGIVTTIMLVVGGPASLLAAGIIGFGALAVGLAYGITNRIYQQRDKDAQIAKKTKHAEQSSEAVILEELSKTPTNSVDNIHRQIIDPLTHAADVNSMNPPKVNPSGKPINTELTQITTLPIEEKKKRALINLIKLIDEQHAVNPTPLPTVPAGLADKTINELKAFLEQQVQQASTHVLTAAYEQCLKKQKFVLAKFFMQQLKEYGKPASRLAKIRRQANPVPDPNYLAAGIADMVDAQPRSRLIPHKATAPHG